ncbi:MAG: lectin-like domain-containing protein, partial [Pirellulaceae bacterium]
YQGTGDVFFNSGNPIEVRLVFDADSQTLSENLFDTVTLKSFQRVYSGIDLRAVLGAEAYIGFTGSVGGASSIQKVSQFQVKEGVSKGFREAVDSTTLLDGFSDWMQVGHITSHSSDQLTVTDGTSSTATAYWNPEPISIASEGKVRVQFTYQASGNKAGDGLAMVFQTQGVAAIGSNGGSLGYVGIGGPTAAYLINLNDASGRIAGSNFVTTNASGNYSSTEWVRFKDGNPISVRLEFDLAGKTLTETLVDTVTNQTYQKVHPAVDLHGLFGSSNVYVGFTGATGGTTAVQKASHFLLESRQSDASTIWKRPIRLGSPYAPSGTVIFENNPEYRESIVATVTQSATATTTFSSDFK